MPNSRRRHAHSFVYVCSLALTVAACGKPDSGADRTQLAYSSIDREAFNFRAAELHLPLFWREDSNKNGAVEPDELAVLTAMPRDQRSFWVDASNRFTKNFSDAYERMRKSDPVPQDASEQQRLKLVREELAQGRPTLVETDLTKLNDGEKKFLGHMLTAADLIERLYAKQKGVFDMEAQIVDSDTASRAVFHRNQSPFCVQPKTENDPACTALAPKPPRAVGLYPADIQSDPKFCEMLEKQRNASALMDHFSVVVKGEAANEFKAVPYHEAYAQEMSAIAAELEAASAALGDDEAALKSYLTATAKSFRSNDWEPANEAWVAMNAQNSKWFLRIAPDEVYYDPCAWKAGFAFQLARINPESLEWQRKLDPLKNEMESKLAQMAGQPYKARDVKFAIPDFIDVVLNAGDKRPPTGATVGQSLPNWGRVAEQGGRTVAMTNFYTDADSQAVQAQLMASMFCPKTNELALTTPRESTIGSLLHEAAHNLGPSHEYKVNGKEDDQIFGSTMASTLEELKAQTSSLYLTDWLATKGIFTPDEARKIQVRNVAWAFGHISRGMYAADGVPRNYSQLAAMQIGVFLKDGGLEWHADAKAANGSDQGCIEVNFDKLAPAIEAFETTVLKIKGSGDRKTAEALKAQYVDAKDDYAQIKQTITERYLRTPKASFVYSVRR
jgi:roadblock/LC7 domain-containing protein